MRQKPIIWSRKSTSTQTKRKIKYIMYFPLLLSSPGPSLSPSPCPYRPPTQIKVPQKGKNKDLDQGFTLKSHGPPTTQLTAHSPHSQLLIFHPKLLSMRECSLTQTLYGIFIASQAHNLCKSSRGLNLPSVSLVIFLGSYKI